MNVTSTAPAVGCLAGIFHALLADGGGMADFEARALRAGHALMAEAMALALEARDSELCAALPAGSRVHDRRPRTLATQVGDVSFRRRRVRDASGLDSYPLDDELDLPYGSRVSPGACEFLVHAGAEVSYARAAALLARAGGSGVSATKAMAALRAAGAMCEAEDAEAAEALFADGVLPGGEVESPSVMVEADGTWVRLQGVKPGEPERVEVKALVAYDGKEVRGGKVRRTNAVHFGCVGTPAQFWTRAVAAVGSVYDLSAIERCHLGTDGEACYADGGRYLPASAGVTGHLDPFHVNRAVTACFAAGDAAVGRSIAAVAADGDAAVAAKLLDIAAENGVARPEAAARAAAYLRNNAHLIGVPGPSLGTMESEQQHVYGARMDSVPCAWSRAGAASMASVRSRLATGRPVPRPGRAGSVSPKRAARRERRMLAALARRGGAGSVLHSSGSGWLPRQASVSGMSAEVRHAAAVDSSMAF